MDDLSDVGAFYSARGIGGRVGWGTRPALVVIDLSLGFTNPDMPLGSDLTAVIAETRRLLRTARECRMPVFFTSIAYDEPDAEGGHWVRKIPALRSLRMGTAAVDIDPRLERRRDEPVVFKKFASAFAGTPLAAMLQHRRSDTIILCGTSTSGCIRASAVDGVQLGFRCIVPEEAVGDRARIPHQANLFDIDQKYGDVVPVGDVLDAMVRIAVPNQPDSDRAANFA